MKTKPNHQRGEMEGELFKKLLMAANEIDRVNSMAYFHGCKDLLKPEASIYLRQIWAVAHAQDKP